MTNHFGKSADCRCGENPFTEPKEEGAIRACDCVSIPIDVVQAERKRIAQEISELIAKYEPAYDSEDRARIAGLLMALTVVNNNQETK